MLWQYILPVLFLSAVVVQLLFILGVFTKLNRHEDFEADTDNARLPSVSIVVAAWNELHNLKELLPILEAQDYPKLEIIVADDRSTDGTYDYLLFNEGEYRLVKHVRIESLPNHFTAKKYAVTMAIKRAANELILLTDADCRPNSEQWVRKMVAQLTQEKEIVLGFSPYRYYAGNLNAFIRYETFQTAIQYFSFALVNMPFMGVGRNLMYRQRTFWDNHGFASHQGLLSGDDDLFVNEVSTKRNVSICIDESTHTVSEPKLNWKDWITQKQRHLSVGKKYKFRDRVALGLLWLSHLVCWFIFVPVFFVKPDWFEAPEWSRIPKELMAQYHLKDFYLYNDWMRLMTMVFVVWLLARWVVLAKANKKLSNTINSWKIPFYDFLYACYLLVGGLASLFSNPKKIIWR